MRRLAINPLTATGLFLYPMKTSEIQRFSDVFRGYKKLVLVLKKIGMELVNIIYQIWKSSK